VCFEGQQMLAQKLLGPPGSGGDSSAVVDTAVKV
jgi:hypothetical protein